MSASANEGASLRDSKGQKTHRLPHPHQQVFGVHVLAVGLTRGLLLALQVLVGALEPPLALLQADVGAVALILCAADLTRKGACRCQ